MSSIDMYMLSHGIMCDIAVVKFGLANSSCSVMAAIFRIYMPNPGLPK